MSLENVSLDKDRRLRNICAYRQRGNQLAIDYRNGEVHASCFGGSEQGHGFHRRATKARSVRGDGKFKFARRPVRSKILINLSASTAIYTNCSTLHADSDTSTPAAQTGNHNGKWNSRDEALIAHKLHFN